MNHPIKEAQTGETSTASGSTAAVAIPSATVSATANTAGGAAGTSAPAGAASKVPKRSEIDPRYKWSLEDVYADDGQWEVEHQQLAKEFPTIITLQGHLTESADNVLACLKLRDDLCSRCEKLFTYAKMRRDEDNTQSRYQAFTDKAMTLFSDAMAACSYIEPELLSAGRDTLDIFMSENKDLALYGHFFDELFRQKDHILSAREEALLAMASDPLSAASDIYTKFTNADLQFPPVHNEDGVEIELTEGRYVRLLENPNRSVRQETFTALYQTYERYKNTTAASLSASIRSDKFFAAARNYPSDIDMYLDSDLVPTSLYDSLIETVDSYLPLLHRYLRLRKKLLGVDELHMYDLYTPIITGTDRHIGYQKAGELLLSGLSVLGDDYVRDLEHALTSGWIDVYENENKTRGAYSWGSYHSHPYVLMNYQNTLDDVLTLAHELGHALHSYYTNRAQPFVYSEYKIFVAEVASTVNESIMLRSMIRDTSDPREKAYLLNRQLETIRGTLFRQTMFAEFERIIHHNVLEGEPLTPDSLSATYKALNDKYFAAEVSVDPQIALEWSRIPHFYNAFYVYKYATGISAATSLTKQLVSGDPEAVKRYRAFLASGCRDYPLNLLKAAGVDLTTPEPIIDAMDIFKAALDELEALPGIQL